MKSLVVVHDLYHVLLPKGLRYRWTLWLQRMFLSGCDNIVVTSQDTARRLLDELDLKSKKIHVIPPGFSHEINPLDHGDQHQPYARSESHTLKILFAGMVIEEKGVIDLALSQGQLLKEGVKIEVHLAGRYDIEPKYADHVRKVADENQGTLVFHGFLSKPDLHALYQSCDIFVLPSYYETFGMVLLEAMQFGLPIVATNQGGIPGIVSDGKTGLLYTPGDVNALTEQLQRLVDDKKLRQKLGEAGKKNVLTLPDWNSVKIKFQNILDT